MKKGIGKSDEERGRCDVGVLVQSASSDFADPPGEGNV